MQERDVAKYNVILHKANCTTFNFSCRAKLDEYNVFPMMVSFMDASLMLFIIQGQTRTRYGITRISPLNYKEEAMALRDLLHSAWAQ